MNPKSCGCLVLREQGRQRSLKVSPRCVFNRGNSQPVFSSRGRFQGVTTKRGSSAPLSINLCSPSPRSRSAQNLIIKPLNDLFLTSSSENDFQISWPRHIIVEGLDECGQAKNQRYVLEVLSTVTRDLTYPLLFFVASRPGERVIYNSFSEELMSSITTRLALDDTYKPNADIEQFLRSKFHNIIMSYPARADIPSGWPSDEDVSWLIERSSGQFIHASTVVKFLESTCHLPQERLKVVFGLLTPEIATHFAELDALYNQIFTSVIQIEKALGIFMVLILFRQLPPRPDILLFSLLTRTNQSNSK